MATNGHVDFSGQTWRFATLLDLRDLGVDPESDRTRHAIELVHANVTWSPWHGDSPFFQGEEEPCINGRVVALGTYFGKPSPRLVDLLLSDHLGDGGWNCEAPRGSVRSSFHTTICVLEGLLAHEQFVGSSADQSPPNASNSNAAAISAFV